MLFGKVTRSLVATVRVEGLGPGRLLHIQVDGRAIVAADTVNAHVGQHVLVLTGCAAQQLSAASDRVGDAVVVAIVDGEGHFQE